MWLQLKKEKFHIGLNMTSVNYYTAKLTYQTVFGFNRTAVGQEPSLHVDFHDVSSGGATVNELIILWNLCYDQMESTWRTLVKS